ncbi:DNA methyltransferase [Nocardioides sp. CFH 31398]|uniref:DNA methyltransferase n=1 Tax=Nocardioides sp. CFH 31398 TaxID=2919579 RepID=UPI001F06D8EA|nr:DNA methyltransferase [Nocardioides sp. CFH 31398]MCH1867088.1 restriction endonuclease [Nocardioides sp. CFH 31398]
MADPIETGVLYREDNLTALRRLPAESVDLVYLDPPFFSSRVYEVIWGDEAEVRSFEDRWDGGIRHYVGWMRERARLLHRVLKPTGSLYLHCDPNASHYLKVMLDDLFGIDRFRGEVTWQRTTTHNDAKRWSPNSDTLLYYGKTNQVTWNAVHVPHDPTYVAQKYRFREADGRRFALGDMTSPNPRPNLTYEWKGHAPPKNGWRYSVDTMTRLHEEGRIWYPDAKAKRPRLKQYLDENPGPVAGNIWTDIAPLNSRARERLGYPTQKPEALLARILEASSNRGDVVLDPFCGCGTTVSVAQKLGRRWVGIDVSPTAMDIMNERLGRIVDKTGFRIVGLPDTVESLRDLKPFEFQNWVIRKFVGTHSPRKSNDLGIDGYSFMVGNPIQVKRSDRVGRNVVDNFETAMRRGGHDKGYIVAFSFTRNAREEVARARWEDGLEIDLLTVADLLKPQLDERIPELATVTQLPLPPSRPVAALPSATELAASDQGAAAV